MKRYTSVILAAAVFAFAVGCGGKSENKLGIEAGDKLVVTTELPRESFEASYGESVKSITNTDGANISIPEGTVLEVFVTPRNEARTIEVVPVKVGEVTDAGELRDMFVQERYRTEDLNFLYYTISLNVDYLSSGKIKKVE
ncbi:MAG: hypothetical protein LBH93_03480 [Chitinispirillales bacterium]|nr:hypothetical protein [Chitinispirillales bacterium]